MADGDQFDVQGARSAGYSDDEILQHLGESRRFDVQGALGAGYSKQEVIDHLSKSGGTTQTGAQKVAGTQTEPQSKSWLQAVRDWVPEGMIRRGLEKTSDWATQKVAQNQEENIHATGIEGKPAPHGELGEWGLRNLAGAAQFLGHAIQPTPKEAAIGTAAIVAPEITGPAMVAHGGYQMLKNAPNALKNPEAMEATLSGGAEAAGGGAMTGGAIRSPEPTMTGTLMRAANQRLVKPTAEAYTIGMPGEAMVKKGVAPYAKQTGYDAAMEQASNEILRQHEETPIKSVKDLHEALPEIQQRIEQERMDPVARRRAEEILPRDRMIRIQGRIANAASPALKEFDEESAAEIQALADKIGSKPRTIGELIGRTPEDRGGVLGYING